MGIPDPMFKATVAKVKLPGTEEFQGDKAQSAVWPLSWISLIHTANEESVSMYPLRLALRAVQKD